VTQQESLAVRYEPAIDRDQLASAVGGAYRLAVTDLAFIPVGFAAAAYRLESSGAIYFLKVWPSGADDPTAAAQRRPGLRLARALYERDVYPRVDYPLRSAAGALAATYAGGEFALFPYLEGAAPPVVWPSGLQDEWARTLAVIHRATPALADVLPERERFGLGFEAELQRDLDRLASLGPDARLSQRRARELVLSRQREIEAQVTRLRRLQRTVRRLDGPFVLCHTDMGAITCWWMSRGGSTCWTGMRRPSLRRNTTCTRRAGSGWSASCEPTMRLGARRRSTSTISPSTSCAAR
jgi:hypothetical protein